MPHLLKNQFLFKQGFQLVLFWCLLTTVMLPSLLNFFTVSILFCISTSNLINENIKEQWRQTRTTWIGLSLFLIFGMVFSELPEKSTKASYDVLRHLILFYFITSLFKQCSDRDIAKSLSYFSLFISYVFLLIVIYAQYREGSMQLRGSPLGQSIWGSHNLLSTGITIFLLLTMCLITLKSISIKLGLLIALPLIYAIAFTLSRGNILSVIVIATFLIFHFFKLPKSILLGLFFIMLIGYCYLFFIFPCDDGSCNLGIYPRQYIYQNTLDHIIEKPIFGHGLSVFKIISGIQEGGVNVVMPHNLILELFYSVGIIGSFIFLVTLTTWFYKSGWTFSLLIRSHNLPLPIIIGISLFIYLFIRGLFDLKLVSSQTFGLLAIIYSLLYSRKPLADSNLPSKPEKK